MKNKIKLLGFIFLFVVLLSITGLTVYATGENNQFEINPKTYGSTIKIEKVWNVTLLLQSYDQKDEDVSSAGTFLSTFVKTFVDKVENLVAAAARTCRRGQEDLRQLLPRLRQRAAIVLDVAFELRSRELVALGEDQSKGYCILA